MLAAVVRGAGDLAVEDVPTPEPGPVFPAAVEDVTDGSAGADDAIKVAVMP
jgi:hypothetical protein